MSPQTPPHPPPGTKSDASDTVRRLFEVHFLEIHEIVRGIVIASRVCPPDEFGDVLGEVAKQVLAKAASYDPRRPFVPWVLGFVGFVLAARKRQWAKQQKQVPLSQLHPEANAEFWDELLPRKKARAGEDARQLKDWLGKLSEQDRRLIELRYFHNCQGQELADAMGVPTGTARTRLCRALKRLRQIAFGEEGGAA